MAAAAPPGGILNIGSGIGLPTGRLALWIIEGYGRGELVIAEDALLRLKAEIGKG